MQYKGLRSLIISLLVLLTFNIHLSSAYAGELSQSGLHITFLRETSDRVLVGFSPAPTECAGSYQGAHAVMGRAAPQFKETVIRLRSFQLLGVPATVYYVGIGDCTDEFSLLQLSNIEVQ